ncbi:insulinase family protein [Patescibacteria group bacterium]|nr:insulinase family protein [Patescibacteria group bacterium]
MKFKKKTLKNGLRIITAPLEGNLTTTVLVLVKAGTDYEDKNNNGISHFLEHMSFKATKNRPNTGDIPLELDKLGSRYNAFTSYEYTGYWAKAHHKQGEKILDIISDMYLNPVFEEKEIKKEKGVILGEFNMYRDLPMRQVEEDFLNLLYKDQPSGMQVLGSKKNINKFKQKDFLEYRNKRYVAENTVIVVSGKFDEKKIILEIQKKFKDINSIKSPKKIKIKDIQNKPEVFVRNKKVDQTHLILGVRAYNYFNKDNMVVSLIANILGFGLSSRLFKKMRDEMGVCYYVRAENDPAFDHGFFGISAGVDNKRLNEVVGVLLIELKKLKEELVSENELQKVKDSIVGNIYLGLESSDSIANYFGSQELLKDKILTPEEKIERIKAVTSQDIKRVANRIFVDKGLNLAVIGPIKDKKPLQKILKF